MTKVNDIRGKKFGRLVVIERAEDYVSPKGRHVIRWKCQCDCGGVAYSTLQHLKSGDVASCGCLGKERRAIANANKPTHKKSRTRIYHLYQNMKYRCESPKAKNYHLYGGRGIAVCEEWMGKGGFEKFYEWAMSNGYRDDLTIDRIDVNGDYSPDNCRWADTETQCNNTRNSVKLTYNGETLTAAQWAKRIGIDRHTIYGRIKKGLPIEEVLGPKKK